MSKPFDIGIKPSEITPEAVFLRRRTLLAAAVACGLLPRAFTAAAATIPADGALKDLKDWPYREGLTIEEAMHPLTLATVGLYGKVLPNQSGAPLRIVIPWKYGFKGAKSVVRIHFLERQPETSWNMAAPREYGFYSNVNP